MHSQDLLIYGATGYSGRLIVQRAMARGLRPVVAARDESAVAAMAKACDLPWMCVRVDDVAAVRKMAGAAKVLINTAGPFSATAGPIMDACVEKGTHYLDITGESSTIEPASQFHVAAERRGIMIMPAAGFDVVASDCLAVHVARRLPGGRLLRVGFDKSNGASAGSLRTTLEMSGKGVLVRRAGELVRAPVGAFVHDFDYGRGPEASFAVNLGDVASAFYSTGIPDIETYMCATPAVWTAITSNQYWGWLLATPPMQRFLKAQLGWFAKSVSPLPISQGWGILVAEVSDDCGRSVRSRMFTGDVYWYTALSSVGIAERCLGGEFKAGFQTPAKVYGPDFALTFEGARREDL
jgi:short subunit dehydrogenase-like uncharacterized protein